MSGLKIIFADEFKTGPEWKAIPTRRKTGWLREMYWANRVKDNPDNSFFSFTIPFPIDAKELGRRHDDPGDLHYYWTSFSQLLETGGTIKRGLKWIEVTEVFTMTEPKQLDRIMKIQHGLQSGEPNEVANFIQTLDKHRPPLCQEKQVADCVISAIRRKINKTSYQKPLEKYGYGTLVVGLPLWFACPPVNPTRILNALDNFHVRTALGLREIACNELKEKACPFNEIVVVWDVTMTAIEDWWDESSKYYSSWGGHTISNPFTVGEILNFAVESNKGNEMMGMKLYLSCRAKRPKRQRKVSFSIEETINKIVQKQSSSDTQMFWRNVWQSTCFRLRFARIQWNVFRWLHLARKQSKLRTTISFLKLLCISRWVVWKQSRLYKQSTECTQTKSNPQ